MKTKIQVECEVCVMALIDVEIDTDEESHEVVGVSIVGSEEDIRKHAAHESADVVEDAVWEELARIEEESDDEAKT